jgi:3-oxoacyl-[acyl-carrier-protein] synthase II
VAAVAAVVSDRGRRASGSVGEALGRLWTQAGIGTQAAVISGATGVAGITGEERDALARLAPHGSPRATGDVTGHTMEAQAPAGAALAAALVARGEAPEAVVTSVGHHRGEGLVRIVPAA